MCTHCVPIAPSSYRSVLVDAVGRQYPIVATLIPKLNGELWKLPVVKDGAYLNVFHPETMRSLGLYSGMDELQTYFNFNWYKIDLVQAATERAARAYLPALNPACGRIVVDWQSRERERLADGTYKPMPDIGIGLDPAHFVHRSTDKDQEDYIAYTPSEAYGLQDRQTRIRLGRYLKKHHPDLSEVEIVAAVDRFKTALARESAPYELMVTTEKETINEIFETQMWVKGSNVDSCMYGKFDGWNDRPYHVYADSPDVAVAYLVKMDEIVARSVVATKTKQWVRAYAIKQGESDYHRVLIEMLEADGYKQGDLDGCRLSKVPSNGRVKLPYIDGDSRWVTSCGNYWVVSDSGDYCGDRTDGFGEEEEEDRCSTCERPEDDCCCDYCACCEESFPHGCDECSMCPECDRCILHDRCGCERCSECNELVSPRSRYTTRCGCIRCDECNALEDECECARCSVCNELETNCECEEESETNGSINITPDAEVPAPCMV